MKRSLSIGARRDGRLQAAFTLAEILVVLVIIAIIAAFAMPAMNSVLRGSKLTLAADQLVRDLNLARQVAVKDNSPVEFRFYKIDDPEQPGAEKAYRSYQACRRLYDPRDSSNFEVEAVTPVRDLPDAVVISDSATYSTLIADTDVIDNKVESGNGESSRVEGENYKSFIFLTDGALNLPDLQGTTLNLWHFTLVRETDDPSDPKEFVTIQIDASTGHIRRYDK
jgi:uncharacterized protein (TIGR02596 family)